MTTHTKFLADIEAFLSRHGMTYSAFGRAAVGDTKLVFRLRRGSGVTSRTMDRVYEFMARFEKGGKPRPKLRAALLAA